MNNNNQVEEGSEHRFGIDDDWEPYLETNGYVVIKSVADAQQTANAIDLFWKHFTNTHDVDRHDRATWTRWGVDRRGIITDGGVIQSEGAWYVRGLPNVKRAFAKIWKTESLIVSMDSLLLWRPWWHNSAWKPRTEGLHIDQNPFTKPGKLCVQGMVALFDVTRETGGLEVVPRSNNPEQQTKLREVCPHFKTAGDFCMIGFNSPVVTERKLILAKAGDLILWDSRTIHGGLVGTGKDSTTDTVHQLCRMSMTVCMIPKERATPEVLQERREGFRKGYGFTHWPDEINITSYGNVNYKPVELTPEQDDLL